jgi:glycosyltransferase involved in cell wall biosynthesis
MQLGRAVTFASFDATERAALGAQLRSCDVVALMSDYEANPVAIMEALALGRRVLVADTSGLSELATEGLAAAVPPDIAPAELARVLVDVAHGPPPVIPDLPDWDGCAGQLLALYEEILTPPRG